MPPQEPDGAVPAIQMAIAPFDRGHDAVDLDRAGLDDRDFGDLGDDRAEAFLDG